MGRSSNRFLNLSRDNRQIVAKASSFILDVLERTSGRTSTLQGDVWAYWGDRFARRGQDDLALSCFDMALLRIPSDVGANLSRLSLLSSQFGFHLQQNEKEFQNIEVYCSFIGYPRSGHSLLGALIDAHPQAIVSHELDAMQFVAERYQEDVTRVQLLNLIVENSKLFARYGRHWQGHDYHVPGGYQGFASPLRVVGDKKGDRVVSRFRQEPSLLTRLQDKLELPFRFIHACRHPLDNIARISKRDQVTVEEATNKYFGIAETVREIRALSDVEFLDITNEDLIGDSTASLGSVFDFLNLKSNDDFLEAAASILFASPNPSRNIVVWPVGAKNEIAARSRDFPWLGGYEFD